MEGYNYFIKLLMLQTSENDFTLLYGFCTATTQETRKWKNFGVPKTHRSIWKAILSEEQAKDFIEALTKPGYIYLDDKKFISPELLKRPLVLSNAGQIKESGPSSEYRQVIELWNVHKRQTLQKICSSFGTDGKELYQSVKSLLIWIDEECGIDFFKAGDRLGNFEFYQIPQHAEGFTIETHKECGLTQTTVRKVQDVHNGFIVNCIAKCRGRSIKNQSKIFPPEEYSLDFFADEPMSEVIIQIWNAESGELVFSQQQNLITSICVGMNIGSTQYIIHDPWSEKLFASAANRSDVIKKQIETVSRITPYGDFSIHSSTYNEIDAAIEEGRGLFCEYSKLHSKGAFVLNHQKDGEIESFLKIREYIELASVKKVIIADPYFSIDAATKLLTRIPRTDIQIVIVTSLGGTDPDTGKKSNVIDRYRKFFEDNAGILHKKLLVYNLKRGSKQVFHDRFLIRYFGNGKIDGFLLGNSLNSMGQFYPFVIAPLDQEVCLEVCDYIGSMCDYEVQKQLPRKERIESEILFDSKANKTLTKKTPSKQIPLSTWLSQWNNGNEELFIPKEDLADAVSIIMEHWNSDEELACQVLCSLGSTTYPWDASELAKEMQAIEGACNKFVNVFTSLAKESEKQSQFEKDIDSEVYGLWTLLNEDGKLDRQGFSLLFEQAGHIYYSGSQWLHGGYTLLLWLQPSAFAKLIDNTKSPLMFDILAARMYFYSWSNQLYYTVIKMDSMCLQLLCAEWLFSQVKMDKLHEEDIKNILNKVVPEKRALQAAYLLSQITFHVRTVRSATLNLELWESLSDWLIRIIISDLPLCTSDIQEKAIYWIYDCEDISHCRLHLNIAKATTVLPIRERLLDKAIAIAEFPLQECSYDRDVSELISLYLCAMDIRYGTEAEKKIIREMIDWDIFEVATEPELKNYAYDKWHSAYIRAKRQMDILCGYHQRHPENNKTGNLIKIWQDRLTKS